MAQTQPPQDPPRRPRGGAGPQPVSDSSRAVADHAWSGQHEQAIALASAALLRPRLGAAQQIELLDRRADSHMALGRYAEANDDARSMLQRARQVGSAALTARSLCR